MAKLSENEVLEIIQKGLNLNNNKLSLSSSMQEVAEWDSLGHLGILTALDKAFEGRTAEIKDLATADSVGKIIAILKTNSLI